MRRPPPTSKTFCRLAVACWLALTLSAQTGCEKARQERAAREAAAKTAVAIEKYSAASETTNAAHKQVLAAFAEANGSQNLAEYKAALRTRVLPAMDEFIGKLAAMPVEVQELAKIHNQLTEAYRRARDEIAEFERGLNDASGLPKFDEIRDKLQKAVGAYRNGLQDYYKQHDRQLRGDSAPAADAKPASPAKSAAPLMSSPTSTDR